MYGNVDAGLLVTGPVAEIYESTCDILQEYKQDGGLVLSASKATVLEASMKNYHE